MIPTAPPNTYRAVTWNILNGGIDHGSANRLVGQLALLDLYKPDILCLPEATRWHEDDNHTLTTAEDALGMATATLAPSHVGDGTNNTALMYNPEAFDLVNEPVLRGEGAFHHALIRAILRPKNATDDTTDLLVLATHLSPVNGNRRLDEVCMWITDHGGAFPGMPSRSILLGDLNTPDRQPASWDDVPANLHARYRTVQPDGLFGDADTHALDVLLQSGWQCPWETLGHKRPPTVGFYYPNEPVPWALDYTLTTGLHIAGAFTHPWDPTFDLSDHLPTLVDFALTA